MIDTVKPGNSKPDEPWRKPSRLAVISLTLGILSIELTGDLTGIIAIVCGHIAFSRVRHTWGWHIGKIVPLLGLTLGYIALIAAFVTLPVIIPVFRVTLSPFSIKHTTRDTIRPIDNRDIEARTRESHTYER